MWNKHAPSDIPRFQPFLAECKLQAPASSSKADVDRLNDGYTNPNWFYVVDGDKILFNQSGDSQRTELRNETNWDLTEDNRSLHGRIDIVEQTCEQVTVMQIHDDANAGSGPNKPLLRIYKHTTKVPVNHLWAAIKTDAVGINTMHIDLGEDPGGYFNCDIRLVDGRMIIDYEGEEKANEDVSFWTWPSYWKAGVYLQDDGEATAHFDELFEEDGTQQNRFPSVSITSPSNNTNFLPGEDITITVDAEDSDGTVTMVEFFEGGNKLTEITTPPYSYTWTDATEGDYTLTAKATDNEGGSKTTLSTKISVGVPVLVTGVDMIEVAGPISVGAVIQLEAFVLPFDATNQNFVFESDDLSLATVDNDGLLIATTEGVVTITVTTDDGEFVDSETIQILRPSTDFNWALAQSTYGGGAADGNNIADNLFDDDVNTRWSINGFPQSIIVDLGGFIEITQTEATCFEDRAYQFIIEGSLNIDGPYTAIVDRSNNNIPGVSTAPIINSVDNVEARFVRVTVSGAANYTGPWVSLTELRIFGEGERTFTSVSQVANDKVQLYPNPATSIVTMEGADVYDTVTIFDQAGRMVLQRKINNTSLDISGLQSGMYLVKFEGNEIPHVCKLIKL